MENVVNKKRRELGYRGLKTRPEVDQDLFDWDGDEVPTSYTGSDSKEKGPVSLPKFPTCELVAIRLVLFRVPTWSLLSKFHTPLLLLRTLEPLTTANRTWYFPSRMTFYVVISFSSTSLPLFLDSWRTYSSFRNKLPLRWNLNTLKLMFSCMIKRIGSNSDHETMNVDFYRTDYTHSTKKGSQRTETCLKSNSHWTNGPRVLCWMITSTLTGTVRCLRKITRT